MDDAYKSRPSHTQKDRFLEKRATLHARTPGELRLAVIADTHSRPHPKSLSLVRDQKPDAILHAGDIGELSVLDDFREVAPAFAVRGNIDGRRSDLPDLFAIKLLSERPGAASSSYLNVLLVHIGVNGPKLRADTARQARDHQAQLVICGHSHVPFIGRDRGFTVFNPGSIGPRRFTLPIVFGMLRIEHGQLRLWHIDCETGSPWSPP